MVELLGHMAARLFVLLLLSFFCAISWFGTSSDRLEPAPVPMPRWLAFLLRRPPGTPISVYSVARYAFALLWFIWDTAVVMLLPGDQSPASLVAAGALVLVALTDAYALVVRWIQRSHRPPE